MKCCIIGLFMLTLGVFIGATVACTIVRGEPWSGDDTRVSILSVSPDEDFVSFVIMHRGTLNSWETLFIQRLTDGQCIQVSEFGVYRFHDLKWEGRGVLRVFCSKTYPGREPLPKSAAGVKIVTESSLLSGE